MHIPRPKTSRILWMLLLGAILVFGPGLKEVSSPALRPMRSLAQSLPAPPVEKQMARPAGGPIPPTLEVDADLFDSPHLPRVRIELTRAAIKALRGYHWNWGARGGGERPEVKATVYEGDRAYTNVAVHLKGSAGSFRSIDDRPALTLKFDKFASGQRFHGMKKIHLNNSVQDPSYLSEQISRELCLAAGVPTTRATQAKVSLNGRDLGVYVLIEGWNKQFLKRHFKNGDGVLYDGGFAQEINENLEVLSGDKQTNRADLRALLSALREQDSSARFSKVAEIVDVDHFLSFVAMEVMLGHGDGYAMNRNNYRVYHDPDSNRLMFMPHGMDQMFGTFNSSPASSITPPMHGAVARAIIGTAEGRRRYLERFGTFFTNVYNTEVILQRIDDLAARVRPLVAEEGDWNMQSHRQAVGWLRQRVEQRGTSIAKQLGARPEPSRLSTNGELRVTSWQPKREQGNASYKKQSVQGGGDWLEIEVNGGSGSWRARVMLSPGIYEFVGRVRVEEIVIPPNDPRAGVGLRHSSAPVGKRLVSEGNWTELRHEFTVEGESEIELICEMKATRGKVSFDGESLKLVKK